MRTKSLHRSKTNMAEQRRETSEAAPGKHARHSQEQDPISRGVMPCILRDPPCPGPMTPPRPQTRAPEPPLDMNPPGAWPVRLPTSPAMLPPLGPWPPPPPRPVAPPSPFRTVAPPTPAPSQPRGSSRARLAPCRYQSIDFRK